MNKNIESEVYFDMELVEWAKNEIELLLEEERRKGENESGEFDTLHNTFTEICCESALKLFKSLYDDDHNLFTIIGTKKILNALIDGFSLTAIEDTDDIWENRLPDNNGTVRYQCKRMTSLFKYVHNDGSIKYSDDKRCYCVSISDMDLVYIHDTNKFIRNIYDELNPIKMPYIPPTCPDVIMCDDCLSDPKNVDYDTIAVLYINKPNGEKVWINRYFKEVSGEFVEITYEEYQERLSVDPNKSDADKLKIWKLHTEKRKNEIAIDVLEHPSKHICIEKDGSISYSADLVSAFETAIEALQNTNK